ncbi:chaplin [Streptomyces sp. TRM70308]|uniref:chaplin n=1 Tax=Streptomyces sp. TRM70308 TaxID=3131932 RepID=UPI003D074C18
MRRMAKSAAMLAAASALVFTGATSATADADADGAAVGSTGVLSGNVVQVPVNVPINICGNTVNIIALLNPAAGNVCVSGDFGGQQHDKHGDHGQHGW